MENNGTAILLNVKTTDGKDLILLTDHQDKIVSLASVSSYGALSILAVRDYRKTVSRIRVATKSKR